MSEYSDILELVKGYREECSDNSKKSKKKENSNSGVKRIKNKASETCDEFGHLVAKKLEYEEDIRNIIEQSYDDKYQITFNKKAFMMEYKELGYPIPARDICYRFSNEGLEESACMVASKRFGEEYTEVIKGGKAAVLRLYTEESVPAGMIIAGDVVIYKGSDGKIGYKYCENEIFSNRGGWIGKKKPRELVQDMIVSSFAKGE